ncbi:MarR family winged helix-turn-helix transcriptional regulator [Microbacterium sp. MYb62]|uniref:MarR family winged helix-turn-helix transcriptional regulator n=1 Tax=Microbacterium sp. MYb62 TaxID=1848690 RepID=UPI000CFA96DC|nr:MarR family transcriptional regulator [Microbacterium sp. MYb62]PRB14111.1 MarR family transcriptional regulator [Microbacterium sp. MYb62]
MHSQVSQIDRSEAATVAHSWSRVALLASTIESSLDKWLGDTYRVGLTEYRALGFLIHAADKELRVNDLAQQVGLNPSSITRLVHRLEAKGLVRRDLCADDGRGVYAVIEESGEALLREITPTYELRLHALLTELGAHFPHLAKDATSAALTQVQALIDS